MSAPTAESKLQWQCSCRSRALYIALLCGKDLASKVSSPCCEGVSGTSPVVRSLQAKALAPLQLSVPYFLLRSIQGRKGLRPAFRNQIIQLERQVLLRGEQFYLFIYFVHFKKNFLFLLYFTLQYCIGFAIHWHESTTGEHEFPNMNPPPTSHPISSLWIIPMHQPQASCILHQTGDLFLTW